MSTTPMPAWERRFRAPTILFPHWGLEAPDRLVFASDEDGAHQIHALDRRTGFRRRVTDTAIGVEEGTVTPDGADVVWFDDPKGDEHGRWVIEPFEGGVAPRALLGDIPDYWATGLALRPGVTAAGAGRDDGFHVYASVGGGPVRELYAHENLLTVAGLSRDGTLLCVEHAEHGDNIHLALRVVDPGGGGVAGEQWDGPGLGLRAAGWSPVAGDGRLAIVHEREGRERPAIWDLASGERRDLAVDLPGDVGVLGWWPDGSALLLLHEHEGRGELYRLPPDGSGGPERVPHPEGTVSGAGVRPDGEVWLRLGSGARAWTVRRAGPGGGDEVLAPEGPRAPDGQPYRSWSFRNPDGQRIHGFYVTPPTPGPHPVFMRVHGGPTWAYTDDFMPVVQALVGHGFAVAMVNYRGSTGYGVPFRDALIGNPGFPEVEDVVAGLEDLARIGVVDPERAVLGGASWGGYVTLMGVGLRPDRWVAGVAEVPVGDYPSAYADEAPSLQAYDRALFGGTPDELPDLYRERSPLTYVERVRTPLLVTLGENDTRCPRQQVLNYVEALRARGGRVELYRFDAGHGSMVADERVRQMRTILAFVTANAPGTGPQPD